MIEIDIINKNSIKALHSRLKGGKMELLASIIVVAIMYCVFNCVEWKSNNRIPPKGMKTDWDAANKDLVLHGKDYFHKKNVTGGYDVPKDKN